MNFKKIFGIKYKVGDKYFLSKDNAINYADQHNKIYKVVWFCYKTYLSDEWFERLEKDRIFRNGFVNHRDR